MDAKVPYLNISDKQYRLIGITWGLILAAFFHYYHNFSENQNSIVLTFFSSSFAIHAIIGMISGYILSCFVFRYINKNQTL